MTSQHPLKLKGFEFSALLNTSGLNKLDQVFLMALKAHDVALHTQLLTYRANPTLLDGKAVSQLLIDAAFFLEAFLAELFDIETIVEQKRLIGLMDQPIFAFKEWYVKKQARRRTDQSELTSFAELNLWLTQALENHGIVVEDDLELAVATLGQQLLVDQEKNAEPIENLIRWSAQALYSPEGRVAVNGWVSFQLPKKVNHGQLVPHRSQLDEGLGIEQLSGLEDERRERDGFGLTDKRMSARQVANQIDYCVYCHEQSGDFCSKGFPVKKSDPTEGLRTNPLGEVLTGCPLEEKISEMHVLKRDGYSLAALAVVMVDNPMCPMTGHRICNDCMKACIYQKQEPVNIPEIETRVLTDVLNLPWGVEIYDLLTRWNPLRPTQWVMQPYNGKKVLIAGMGPAGLTLAHHLLMEGCAVVGVDGLKIEPLDPALIDQPIHQYQDLIEGLDDRLVLGFGGVAEYGITVRWDKNFLKLVYLNLLRRPYFQAFGGMRFGGTIAVEDAWEMGFDHLAVAVGAGLPKALPIPGSLAPGMRQANDFLMALQLTGAAKAGSLANLQVRLPALVIGGGLTGIDTATEVQAYYIKQVEKILYRYERLVEKLGEAAVRGIYQANPCELAILDEWLAHGQKVREERAKALQENRSPKLHALIEAWGGVSVVYRRSLKESPAYRRNHEEVRAAFQEGIHYIERSEPIAAEVDQYGHVSHLVCQLREQDDVGRWVDTDHICRLPARAIFVATGAMPNVAYGFEHAGTFERKGFQYLTYKADEKGNLIQVTDQRHCKQEAIAPLTSYQKDNHRVSILGDTHPVFHGSVVKAVASAKRSYPSIMRVIHQENTADKQGDYSDFSEKISAWLTSRVVQVDRIKPDVVKVIVQAPMAAKKHLPGQFYRLQNFETDALTVEGTQLQAEGVALLGIPVDEDKLAFIVDERGASSRLLALLTVGQRVALMGPTGVRTKIPDTQENILIIGDQHSIAFVCAVGPAMRAAGNRVLCVLSVPDASALHHQALLEAATDVLLTATAGADWREVLLAYAQRDTSEVDIDLRAVNRVHVNGSSDLVRQMQAARAGALAPYLKAEQWIASVYGPMQCMLKGVCAQCLQWQIDPKTGERTKAVFACSWQDQPMDIVDFDNLDERLAQNSVQEKLTNLWLDNLLVDKIIKRRVD